jgi:Tyrosine-protein kinase ephrin type A/B receptor-like
MALGKRLVWWTVFCWFLFSIVSITLANTNYTNDEKCTISNAINSSLCPTGCYSSKKAVRKHSERMYDLLNSSSNKDQGLKQLKSTFDRKLKLDPGQCQIVPYGYYSPDYNDELYPCPAGTYSNTGSSNCTLCPIGTYTFRNASGSCLNCPVGQSTVRLGSTYCVNCLKSSDSNTTYNKTLLTPADSLDDMDQPALNSNNSVRLQQQKQQRCIVSDRPSTQQPTTSPSDEPSFVPSSMNRSEETPAPHLLGVPSSKSSSSNGPLSNPHRRSQSPTVIPSLYRIKNETKQTPIISSNVSQTGPKQIQNISKQPQKVPVSFPRMQIFDQFRKPAINNNNNTSITDDVIKLAKEKQQQVNEKRRTTIALIIKFTVGVSIVVLLGLIAAWYKKKYRIPSKMAYIKLQFLFHRPIPNPPPPSPPLYSDSNDTNIDPLPPTTTTSNTSNISENTLSKQYNDDNNSEISSSLLSVVEEGTHCSIGNKMNYHHHKRRTKHKTY